MFTTAYSTVLVPAWLLLKRKNDCARTISQVLVAHQYFHTLQTLQHHPRYHPCTWRCLAGAWRTTHQRVPGCLLAVLAAYVSEDTIMSLVVLRRTLIVQRTLLCRTWPPPA
jgi:hypothetical protein